MSRFLTAIFLWVALFPVFTVSFRDDSSQHAKNEDDALFLTPYIETGRIKEAQRLATVAPMMKNVESFAGYLTVNKSYDSNLFFWLIKSQQGKWEERPLLVWLSGGPGASSILAGALRVVGPFSVDKNRKLKRRKYTWTQKYNMVFIDNPVGAGFSFTKEDSGYANDLRDITRDLYEALVQLYKLFPVLQKNKLFIVGSSYGGKFALAIAYKILNENKSPSLMNLAGVINVSYLDPEHMMEHHSLTLYNLGFVDIYHRLKVKVQEEEFQADIKAGDSIAATRKFVFEEKYILKLLGLNSLFDYVHNNTKFGPEDPNKWFLNQTETRRAIHAGNNTFDRDNATLVHMYGDVTRPAKPIFEQLLTTELLPILCLTGQLDLRTPYNQNSEWYDSLQWPRAKEYHNAKRCQFKVGKKVAAYYKSAGTLTEVMVRNGGHEIVITQPKWVFLLVDGFIQNSTFFQCN